MTTFAEVTCPEWSHWNLLITAQERVFDEATKQYSDKWVDVKTTLIERGQTQSIITHPAQRFIITEVPPEKPEG